MQSFDDKYGEIHAQLQQDKPLVKLLFETARSVGLQNPEDKIYYPVGFFGDIAVGLDLHEYHVGGSFPGILAKMRLLYEISKGQVDLCSIYAILEGKLGIISEDFSQGGIYSIGGAHQNNIESELLEKVFVNDADNFFYAFARDRPLNRTTFSAPLPDKKHKYPIVDLDHVVAKPELEDLYKEYLRHYAAASDFIIREP